MSVRFFLPREGTLSVKVSDSCFLNCKYCQGKFLSGMFPFSEELIIRSIKRYSSILVSGGFNEEGYLPIERHLGFLRRLKGKIELMVHPGLVPRRLARRMGEVFDYALFDLVGSDRVIKEVMNLDKEVDDYEKTLRYLSRELEVIPHVMLGSYFGKSLGVEEALSIASDYSQKLVLLVLIPRKGTGMEGVSPPSPEEVGRYVRLAKDLGLRVSLGCMRPRIVEYEKKAIESGVDGIANPRIRCGELISKCCFHYQSERE